jgi:hypothetical protein
MTHQIPTDEPAELRAGDTWQWRREDLTDFPASVWTLTYRFKNASNGFEIVAAADGDLYAVSVDATTTSGYAAGEYSWQAQVSDGTSKYTVENGSMTVLASFFATSASTAYDDRSTARKALDEINAKIASGGIGIKEYEINVGGSMRRVAYADLLKWKQYYEALVANEEAAKRAAAGLPDKRRSYVRFSCGV